MFRTIQLVLIATVLFFQVDSHLYAQPHPWMWQGTNVLGVSKTEKTITVLVGGKKEVARLTDNVKIAIPGEILPIKLDDLHKHLTKGDIIDASGITVDGVLHCTKLTKREKKN